MSKQRRKDTDRLSILREAKQELTQILNDKKEAILKLADEEARRQEASKVDRQHIIWACQVLLDGTSLPSRSKIFSANNIASWLGAICSLLAFWQNRK